MTEQEIKIYPFILSGGSGTRLWPLSRSSYPKQFLEELVGKHSLLQQSCFRVQGQHFAAPSFICNDNHRFLIADQLQEIGVKWRHIILEPVACNTAPAALIAALNAAQVNEAALVLLAPSDHVIPNISKFQKTVLSGIDAASAGHIVTLGIAPSRPETGYGYIETDLIDGAIHTVKRFVEKPNEKVAQTYLDAGNFYWNAGIFLYSAQAMIKAFELHAPTILEHCQHALAKAHEDLDFLRLDNEAYSQCENISLDFAIMEKSDNIKCIPLETEWSDLGSWSAIWQHMDKDENGNVSHGDVVFHNAKNSYAHSTDDACLALLGVENVMVVATKDAILVASKDQAAEVGDVVSGLKQEGREEAIIHKRVYRPWGWYEGLSNGERFQVKCLMVKPGAQLSLQSHIHRAEHWVVVSGTVEVTVNESVTLLTENKSTYIPLGAKHRLGNPGKLQAILIEVQSGSYLGEDDIIRYEDDFGRS